MYQNEPNPVSEWTVIGFDLPEDMEVKITVFDAAGRVVWLTEKDGFAGYNQLEIRRAELETSGMLYYRLEAGSFSASKKMIIVD